jgi:alpha-galactosidase
VEAIGVNSDEVNYICAGINHLARLSINVHELVVAAVLTGKKEYVYHAAMLDPHTAAELNLNQIYALVDDLFAAHGDWIPCFNVQD